MRYQLKAAGHENENETREKDWCEWCIPAWRKQSTSSWGRWQSLARSSSLPRIDSGLTSVPPPLGRNPNGPHCCSSCRCSTRCPRPRAWTTCSLPLHSCSQNLSALKHEYDYMNARISLRTIYYAKFWIVAFWSLLYSKTFQNSKKMRWKRKTSAQSKAKIRSKTLKLGDFDLT